MADVLGVFEQAVLVAVAHLRGEGYGRTILKDAQERLGRDVAASAAYATLDRLEAKGLVASRNGESTPARGGRAKRHFTITAAGVRALAAAKTATDSIWRGFAIPLKGRS
jgi:PadR family transcriptional regulator, regulatory protein PadR